MVASTASPREGSAPAPRDANRRRIAHEVRHARDRLNVANGLSRPLEHELTRAFARNYLRTWPYHLLLTLALVLASTVWIGRSYAVLSFAVMAGLILATAIACKRFKDRDVGADALAAWRCGFILSEMAQGIGWIGFSLPLFAASGAASSGSTAHSFVLLAVLLVMLATAILRAPILPAVIAGLAPLSLIVLSVAALSGAAEEQTLAVLTLSAQFFFLYFAVRLNRGTAAALRSRAEMRAGLAELEQIKANAKEVRRRAEEADRAKSLFLATMSHELRTPLNAILGFSEVMKNEVLGSHSTPSYREYSQDIHGSGQHLLSLINEILELARIEAGQYALNEEAVRLGDLVKDMIDAMAPRSEAKGHLVMPVIDAGLLPVRVDPRAVRQMIGNLLSNAIKFTAPGGRISVKAGWTSLGGQYVSVTDDGPGIPQDEIPVVLSSFGRGSLAVSTAEQGAGLGLPIVRGLAELHGGRFALHSRPREGTKAVIILPANRVAAADAPVRQGEAA
jgi:two-component system, cell cycle sensor histidine kinase PleC